MYYIVYSYNLSLLNRDNTILLNTGSAPVYVVFMILCYLGLPLN